MLAEVYIGIDTTAGRRPVTVAMLDGNLNVVYLASLKLAEVVPLLAQYPRVFCGIDAPSHPNRGLLADSDYRQRHGLNPEGERYQSYRACEFDLRRRGIHIYNTPADERKVQRWMTVGWDLYDQLQENGFAYYPERGNRVMFETYPHADYTVLIKRRPYIKTGLEGRMQRQLVLYEQGINVPDGMDLLEEWTRYRFLTGQIPTDRLYEHDQLDALIAAYTAYLVGREPHRVSAVGELFDGQIILPTRELLEEYP